MNSFFFAGGSMKPDAPSYISRKADEQLYSSVLAGEYCNVLTTRQMGKSSLMARTAARLRHIGIACATVDLQGKGDELRADENFYYGVTKQVAGGLKLSLDLSAWWKQEDLLLPAQRMTDFFAEIVLKQMPGRVVVFVDEVDWIIKFKFSDEFFASIRSCFNRRATEPAFERLTFVLLGSAAPAQLIRDATRTPFNIGRGIRLTDFTPEEARPLAGGIGVDGESVLARILHWTDGHPYLTQMLCAKVVENERSGRDPEEWVDLVVQENLLSTSARQEENNLKFVTDRLTQASRDLRGFLRVYRDVLRGKVVKDVPTSAIHTSLRLSGAVKPDAERCLQIRNRVYRRVFNEAWVRERMPVNTVAIAAFAAAVAGIAAFAGWYLLLYPRPYVDQLETASKDVPYDAYAALQKPFLRARADDLFARFWERRGDRDAAIMVRARSAGQGDERRKLASLVGADYPLLIRTLRHGDPVNALTYCPQGQLVTISGGNTERVFEGATWEMSFHVSLPRLMEDDLFHPTAFSLDCKLVATVSDGSYEAGIWETATGQRKSHFAGPDAVWALALSPNAILVATGSVKHTLRVYLAATGREVFHAGYKDDVYAVAFSPDGRLLATASGNTVRVLVAGTGRELSRIHLQGIAVALAFSPDARLLATGGDVTQVFELRTGREVPGFVSQDWIVVALAFSKDGKLLATGSSSGTARVFNVATGREISCFIQQRGISAISFNPDGKLVAIASADKTARVFEVATGRLGSRPSWQETVARATFSRDHKLMSTFSQDHTVRVLEAATGREVSRFAHQGISTAPMIFSEDNKFVAVGFGDKTAWVFDAATGREVSHLALQDKVLVLAFSPDGKLVATGSSDKTARVFEVFTGREVSRLALQGEVHHLGFSPNGKLVATGSSDKTARLFEVSTGREVSLAVQGEMKYGNFSGDSKLIATASDKNTAQVFETATGREVSHLVQEGEVNVVAFSRDGKLVATGSDDNTARVFEAMTGREVVRLAQQERVHTVAFSLDGTLLVTEAGNWLNLYQREKDGWRAVGSRHLPVIWPKTVRFLPNQDQCHHCVEIFRDAPENLLKLDRINFDEYPDAPIQGDPANLLAEWSAKLGLTFDRRGHIVRLER